MLSFDADWVLPGEDLQSDDLGDADHWVSVYEELLSFVSQADPQKPAVYRYQRRLGYWSRRRDELRARNGITLRQAPEFSAYFRHGCGCGPGREVPAGLAALEREAAAGAAGRRGQGPRSRRYLAGGGGGRSLLAGGSGVGPGVGGAGARRAGGKGRVGR